MKYALHHFTWLLRRFRLALICYATAWVLLAAAAWLLPVYRYTEITHATLHIVWLAAGALLLLAVLWQDRAPGADTFWRTRPPRWRAVWASQFAFLVLCIAGPALGCWAVNGWMLRNTAHQWSAGASDALDVAGLFLVLAGIVSLARGWYSLLLTGAAALGCYLAGILIMWQRHRPLNFQVDHTSSYAANWIRVAGLLPAVLAVIVWLLGMWRGTVVMRAAIVVVALLAGPSLLYRPPPPAVHPLLLPLAVQPAGVPLAPGEQAVGEFTIQNVPPGCVAVITKEDISFVTGFTGPNTKPEAVTAVQFHRFNGADSGSEAYSVPGLQSLFPPQLPWYTDMAARPGSPRPPAGFSTQRNQPTALHGTATGYLASMILYAAVPLEENAAAAANGMSITIRELSTAADRLFLRADVLSAASLARPVLPKGGNLPEYLRQRLVPVLHFPGVPMALMLQSGDYRENFHSLQTNAGTLIINTAVPGAEALRGVKFTPEVLRGAALAICAPRYEGNFIADSRGQTLPAPAAAAPAHDLESLLATLDRRRSHDSQDAALRFAALGPPAARAMLRRRWTPNSCLRDPGDYGHEFWKKLITADLIPELTAAARQDSRWFMVAWITGCQEKLAAAALDVVRTSRSGIAEHILTLAAGPATPPDYAALARHLPGTASAYSSRATDKAEPQLWQRVRALPGFPWRELAREQWQALHREARDHRAHQSLHAAAVLAGEATALNTLLESEPRDTPPDESSLTAAEWQELAAMIEGVPADPAARSAWLHEHRGSFTWDAAASRYRLPPP